MILIIHPTIYICYLLTETYMIVYITTNLINGKKYVGADSKNNPNYLGSGKALLRAIKKYGRHNFKKEILEQCIDQLHLREREIYWVRYFNADTSQEYYNISHGGQGGVKGREAWNAGKTLDKTSDEYKKMYLNRRIADKSYITEEWKKKHSERIKESSKFQSNKNKKIFTRKSNGKEWCSEETKQKIGIANRGRVKTDEEIKKRLKTIKETGALSGANNKMSKPVKVKDLTTGETKIFTCMAEVEQKYGISRFRIKSGGYKNILCELI